MVERVHEFVLNALFYHFAYRSEILTGIEGAEYFVEVLSDRNRVITEKIS